MDTNGHTPLYEDYVSFEIAKLLKEKGFDWTESPFYSEQDRDEWRQNNNYTIPNTSYNPDLPFDSETITLIAPHVSLQMAMKWLREVHNCHICVQALITTDGLEGYCPFYTKIGGVFMWENPLGEDYATSPTYEEALEAAIKYCLENLI